MPFPKLITVFWGDLYNKNAREKKENFSFKTAWTLLIGLLVSFSTLINKIINLLSALFGLEKGALLQLVLQLIVLVCCIAVISSKQAGKIVATYSFSSYQRGPAKFILVMLLAIMPVYASSVYQEFKPLPAKFSGVIREFTSGKPVAGARIRVFTAGGDDVTNGFPVTDARGFYTVTCKSFANADSWLKVTAPFNVPVYLPLKPSCLLDTLIANLPVKIYQHFIACRPSPTQTLKDTASRTIINLNGNSHNNAVINGNQNNYYGQKATSKKPR